MSIASSTRKLVVSDGEVERELLFIGRMCVGRGPECEISVNDPRLSRTHAEFVDEDGIARIRDLKSRNGLTLNGDRVTDAALAPGDVVQIAGLSIRYVEVAPPPPTMAMAPADADRTVALHAPGMAPGAAAIPPTPDGLLPLSPDVPGSAGQTGGNDVTRVIPPPAFARARAATPAAPGASEAGAAPAAGQGAVNDSTRVIPAPDFARGRGASPGAGPDGGASSGQGHVGASSPSGSAGQRAARSSSPSSSPHGEGEGGRAGEGVAPATAAPTAPTTPTADAATTRRRSRVVFSWPGRLVLRALALGLTVWALSAWPQVMLLNRVIAANDSARARAVAMWLAADAARAYEAKQGLSTAADAVLAYPGVEGAVIIDRRTGAVVAPGRRGTETIATIRDLKVAPADVVTLRGMVIGDRVEVAVPVVTRDGQRPAVAWLTFRHRPPAESTSVGPILAMSLLGALAASLLIAALIRRMTLAAMTRLRDDVELAISGRLDAVADPLGAKPMREAVDVVNYLITRYRASPSARASAERGGAQAFAGAPGSPGGAGGSGAADHAGAGGAADSAYSGPAGASGAAGTGAGQPDRGAGHGAGSSGAHGAASDGDRASSGGAAHGQGGAGSDESGPGAGRASAASGGALRGGASAPVLPAGIDPHEACWVTTSAFIVSYATPACEGLLGIGPEVVQGQHLVDAATDQAIADAILQCLGALPPAGESRSRVAAGNGRPRAVQIIMRRDGSDQPVTVRFVPEAA